MYTDYIDPEFSQYINRYVTGIVLLKNDISKVELSFELTEAFSNHACRLQIDVKFFDYETLTKEKRQAANNHFYNSSNNSRSKFVSFIYKSQRSYGVDEDEILSFIYHYEFARSIIDGTVRNILPENSVISIEELTTTPFFNYIKNYFSSRKYSSDDNRKFYKSYREVVHRDFDFDCHYHNTLVKRSDDIVRQDQRLTVTDKELFQNHGGNMSDVRRFVLDKEVPFSVGYWTDVVSDIHIDAVILKEKIKEYTVKPYVDINPKMILQIIEKKEKEISQRNKAIEERSKLLDLKTGDYITVEQDEYGSVRSDLGIVKEISWEYNDKLSIQYVKLNVNLEESKAGIKRTYDSGISYSMRADVFKQEVQKSPVKNSKIASALVRSKGTKNLTFKKSAAKR